MRSIQKRFLQILVVELEDLKEDIDVLIQERSREHEQGGITDHVYLNNLAIFRNEERGIEHFIGFLQHLDVTPFETLDALILHCREAFRTTIRSCGLPPFIEKLVARKIEKVKKYVNPE